MKSLKFITVTLTSLLVLLLMAATIIEGVKGTPFTARFVYGTEWFLALWTVVAICSAAFTIRMRLYRRPAVFTLHMAFLVILLGSLFTWTTAESGVLHVRMNESANSFVSSADSTDVPLDFDVRLKSFHIEYYPGTDAAMDYVSTVEAGGEQIDVSMNNIGRHDGYRFTQAGYDSDMQGASFSIQHDPWGIGVTYAGYALLLIGIILTLASRRTRLRMLYHTAMRTAALVLLVFVAAGVKAQTQEPKMEIDKSLTRQFSRICVLYNSRICPISTVANDFVTKLSGKPTWEGYDAEQIFMGWAFNYSQWENERMILIKDKKAQQALGIDGKWASVADFWNIYNEYKLQKPMDEATRNGDQETLRHLRDADEKFRIIQMFYGGEMLRMFPVMNKSGHMEWYSPGQAIKESALPEKEWYFVRKVMDYMGEAVISGDTKYASELVEKVQKYQHVRARDVMPSRVLVWTEYIYNKVNSQRWPVMAYLTVSLVLLIGFSMSLWSDDKRRRMASRISLALLAVMLMHTSALLLARWVISGHLPMSNGYETMQFLAWALLLLTLGLRRRFADMERFGLLLSSMALLVAMISGGNPQITQLMPVLQSPLLSVHVMVIMFSYALFALIALTSIECIVLHVRGHEERITSLTAFAEMLLYPAVFLLAIGIFIGAIWANVSWGRYWSWDPKEVWALVTMLVYAAPLHSSLQWLHRRPLHMHIYLAAAFLVVLMTYFGVNYLLPGLHSYA